ncbi:universal stress protein, partial [candidate division KSB1 bacterium]
HVNVMMSGSPENFEEGFPEIENLIDHYEKQAEYDIEEFRKLSNEHVVLFSETTVRGFSVSEEILQFEKDKNINLIVMGTHGRGMLSHFVMGSVAEKVVRYSSCPVITVNQFGKQIDISNDYKRLLVPLDFSDYSKAGLRYGIAFAKMFASHLDILHVFEAFPPPLIYSYGVESQIQFNPNIKKKSENFISQAVKEIDPEFTRYTAYVMEGKPNREIVAHTETNDMDMIILSTRGLGTVQSFFIGSTADKVIRKVKCPVFAVKEHERDFID